MFDKLEAVEKRYEELTKMIADPELISNQSEWQKLMKEHADISEIVEMSQTAVSYQLRILRGARLVKHRRVGKMIFYSLDDDHINDIINTTVMHLEHEE